MAQPPQEWFLNTPLLWLAALLLIGFLRGPLRNAPVIVKKFLRFAAGSCIALGAAIFLLWDPVQKAAKQSAALTALWVLFSGLTPIAWVISFFWIFLPRSKQKLRAIPVGGGRTDPRTQVQQSIVVSNVPTQRFADVGGLDDAKEQIRHLVQGHLNPGNYERYGLMRNGILLHGPRGTGKTTLLKNIVTQDLARVVSTADDPHRLPMVIFDGKGDLEFFYDLLPHVHRAGRLDQLRVLNPARPDISVRYNPFHCTDDDYMPVVNMVFGSFNLHDEFFAKHQLNYLADIVRVLVHTGQKFNFYDVLVMAIDEQVLKEQVEKAKRRMGQDSSIAVQRRLNFEMSVKNLYQSFGDRERVPKIQGLLNECMTFLDDELSVITGPYEELLSLDEVIEQELILFVSLNVNKNTEPVRALGKMLLQNLQLVVGKRYESEEQRRRSNRPMFSVVLDEFAPFGYRNFAQILQTARGTHTSFLFSMQSLPQLMHVGRGFKEDVTSAPNTTMTLRTRDEESVRYFLRASAEHTVTRRSVSMQRWRLFGYERYQATDRAVEREDRETRALDEHIKNLPKGQMEILMTDDTRGTLHQLLNVRPPQDVSIPNFEPELYPRMRQARADSRGANLRFTTAELINQHRYGRRF